jgi:hypothetical protein
MNVFVYVYNYVFSFLCDEKSQNIPRYNLEPGARAPSMHVVRKHTNFPIISGFPFLCYTGNNQS